MYTQFQPHQTSSISFFIITLPCRRKYGRVTMFNAHETSIKLALGLALYEYMTVFVRELLTRCPSLTVADCIPVRLYSDPTV